MAGYEDSLLARKLHGPMAGWDLHALLLRQIDFRLAGGNWQRGGGKGPKPTPIDLPTGRKRPKPSGADVAQRLRNLGLIPTGDPPAGT